MKKSLKFMKVSSIALMLASAAAFTAVPMSWDVAHAKNAGGNGNGKGGGRPLHAGGHGGGKPAHLRTRTRTHPRAAATTEVVEEEIIDDETTEEDVVEAPRNHGAVASELGWRNAAHASPNARANASPNSSVGRIAAYRDAVVETTGLEGDVTAAEDELSRLTGLTDDEIAAEFPDGGYEDAVADATGAVVDADTALAEAPTSDEALEIIDGAELSDAAIEELHRLLDI